MSNNPHDPNTIALGQIVTNLEQAQRSMERALVTGQFMKASDMDEVLKEIRILKDDIEAIRDEIDKTYKKRFQRNTDRANGPISY